MAQDIMAKVPAEEAKTATASEAPAALQSKQAAAETGMACVDADSAVSEEGPLTFRQNLWERFEFLWHRRVEPSRRLMEQMTCFLQKRAELERKYAESLAGFGVDCELHPKMNSVHAAVDAAVVNFRNRGEQSMTLADEIEHDIVAGFEAVIAQHHEVSKRMLADVQLLMKFVQDRRGVHDKKARKYGSRCAEAEAAAQDCLQGVCMKSEDRLKLAQHATGLSLRARVAEQEYYAAIENANKAQEIYEQHMPHVLNVLQDMEEKRSKCLRDGLRRLAVYETAWLRNMQYDLEATAKASEDADPADELQQFIRSFVNVPEEGPAFGHRLAAAPFHQLGRGAQPRQMTPALAQQVQVQQQIRQLMEDIRPLMRTLLAGDTNSEDQDFLPRLHELRTNLWDVSHRTAFCQVLRSEVTAESPGAEVDSAHGMSVNEEAFDTLVACFHQCLDACHQQNDVWCGRDLMVLAQQFRMAGADGKPVSLLSRAYTHPLWNKVTFWEEVLLLAVCEAHAAEAVWRRSLAAGSQFTQPSMTAFLNRFVGYMMAFGISFEQGKTSVWSTLRKHQAMIGPQGVNAYAHLLLSPYEVGPQAAGPAANAMPQPELKAVPSASAASTPKAEGAPPLAGSNDDFEAVALGVQTGFEIDPTETTPSCVGTEEAPSSVQESNEDPAGSEDDGDVSVESEALRVLAEAQPKVDDVFG